MPSSPPLKRSEIMERFSLQANGFKEKENGLCAFMLQVAPLAFPCIPLKYTVGDQHCLNIWLYKHMGECFNKRRKKKRGENIGMGCNWLMVNKANSYC